MRLKITLKSLSNSSYNVIHNYLIQGFLYNYIKQTEYYYLHEEGCFKYFNFSNIFPVENFQEQKNYNLIVSSPNTNFIKELYNLFKQNIGSIVNIGIVKFQLIDVKKFNIKVKFPLETATPIVLKKCKRVYFSDGNFVVFSDVVSINILKYLGFEKQKMNLNKIIDKKIKVNFELIKNLDRNRFKIIKIDDIYFSFKKGDNISLWLEKLKENALLKFNNFYNTNFYFNEPLFDHLEFKKEVAVNLKIKNRGKAIIIGSLWKNLSVLRSLDNEERKFYQFLFDCGLGILNSLGFGFLNIKSRPSNK